MERWEELGTVAPAELTRARLALHWAAQVPAYAGAAFVDPAADDSHMALTWVAPEAAALASQPSSRSGQVVTLDLTTLAVTLSGPGHEPGDHLALGDCTLAEALAWVTAAFAPTVPGAPPVPFPPYDMPAHPTGPGGVLGVPGVSAAARTELARWYHDADLLLQQVRAMVTGASPVRCWPHHFDIATLVTVAPGKTIGVGLSPGDGSYAEPYLYLTPWPHRPDAPLPALNGGHWHREGWFGAVLPGSALVQARGPTGQAALAQAFLESALSASRALLDL